MLSDSELRRFAKAGVAAELERIYAAFPELRNGQPERPIQEYLDEAIAVAVPRKKKRRRKRNCCLGHRGAGRCDRTQEEASQEAKSAGQCRRPSGIATAKEARNVGAGPG